MSCASSPPGCAKRITDFKTTPSRGETTMKRRRRPIPQSGIKAFTRSREPEGSKGRTAPRPPPKEDGDIHGRRAVKLSPGTNEPLHPHAAGQQCGDRSAASPHPTDAHLLCGNSATTTQEPPPPPNQTEELSELRCHRPHHAGLKPSHTTAASRAHRSRAPRAPPTATERGLRRTPTRRSKT
jgi:hypothetical protein